MGKLQTYRVSLEKMPDLCEEDCSYEIVTAPDQAAAAEMFMFINDHYMPKTVYVRHESQDSQYEFRCEAVFRRMF